jgi:hypothetical protein
LPDLVPQGRPGGIDRIRLHPAVTEAFEELLQPPTGDDVHTVDGLRGDGSVPSGGRPPDNDDSPGRGACQPSLQHEPHVFGVFLQLSRHRGQVMHAGLV